MISKAFNLSSKPYIFAKELRSSEDWNSRFFLLIGLLFGCVPQLLISGARFARAIISQTSGRSSASRFFIKTHEVFIKRAPTIAFALTQLRNVGSLRKNIKLVLHPIETKNKISKTKSVSLRTLKISVNDLKF